jgi:hypothetical protein
MVMHAGSQLHQRVPPPREGRVMVIFGYDAVIIGSGSGLQLQKET